MSSDGGVWVKIGGNEDTTPPANCFWRDSYNLCRFWYYLSGEYFYF